jgi:hypothetical protein
LQPYLAPRLQPRDAETSLQIASSTLATSPSLLQSNSPRGPSAVMAATIRDSLSKTGALKALMLDSYVPST